MVMSYVLNKESVLRQSDPDPESPHIASFQQPERVESEKSIGTMILKEAKEEEPSVHEEVDVEPQQSSKKESPKPEARKTVSP